MQIFLALGSNKGNRHKNLETACTFIQKYIGSIKNASSVIETESWGYDDAEYLNNVIEVETKLSPEELLSETQKIEICMGRTQKTVQNADGSFQYSARIIDIDLLFYENQILNSADLTIPHLQLHKRDFVLKPMTEIAPNFIHPIFKKDISSLLSDFILKNNS